MPASFRITNSHPRLTWLKSTGLPRLVPQHVVQQLTKIKTMDEAQAFVSGAGLRVVSETERLSQTANSVTVMPPFGEEEYHGPQIILPKIICREVPAGTALMNCLLPVSKDRTMAELVFRSYQTMVLAFCQRMEALPLACITGHKTETPEHDLSLRGFRFFFGSDPDQPFQRINRILQAFYTMTLPGNDKADKRQAAAEYQNLKFCDFKDRQVGHSLLDDVKFYSTGTTLVDLRSATAR
ncbi:hypothetical protein ACFL37_02440 [Candidatus Margulisiibacteriota bacterium]